MTDKPKTKIVVGLMSGTSVDGIDTCIIRIFPDLSFEFIEGIVYPYPDIIREKLFDIFQNKTSIEEICWMNFVVGECFANAALEVISKAGLSSDKVDLIGSHGQTVFHKPDDDFIEGFNKKSTLQIGDSSVISERTEITTIADFRPADIAAGGQGAPLVSFADEIIFKKNGQNRAIQNIGGMSNVTIVGPEIESFAFDIGPGNVIIDYCAKKYFGLNYDKNGELASKGNVDEVWLKTLLEEPYYSKKTPKTTGRELFSPEYIEKALQSAPDSSYDVMATVTTLTAKTIFNAYIDFVYPKVCLNQLVIGGGGVFNPVLVEMIKKNFGNKIEVLTHVDFGISDDFKEAIAFALLAYATYYKIPNNIPSCTGACHRKILGKISY